MLITVREAGGMVRGDNKSSVGRRD